MSRALGLTAHAIERYRKRWAPLASEGDARAELRAVVDGASPTRRQTLRRDARVWVGTAPGGQQVALAVRDDAVITVFAPDAYEACASSTLPGNVAPEDDPLSDSAAVRDALAALATPDREGPVAASSATPSVPVPDPTTCHATDRRTAHERTVARWRAGDLQVTERAARRAYAALGLRVEPRRQATPGSMATVVGPALLRIEGGRYGGIVLELRAQDTVATIAGRLLGAMRHVDETARRVGR